LNNLPRHQSDRLAGYKPDKSGSHPSNLSGTHPYNLSANHPSNLSGKHPGSKSGLNQSNNLYYLHRGTNSLSFRFPKDKFILNILKISGPLIAPSVNWEGYEPTKNIKSSKNTLVIKFFI